MSDMLVEKSLCRILNRRYSWQNEVEGNGPESSVAVAEIIMRFRPGEPLFYSVACVSLIANKSVV